MCLRWKRQPIALQRTLPCWASGCRPAAGLPEHVSEPRAACSRTAAGDEEARLRIEVRLRSTWSRCSPTSSRLPRRAGWAASACRAPRSPSPPLARRYDRVAHAPLRSRGVQRLVFAPLAALGRRRDHDRVVSAEISSRSTPTDPLYKHAASSGAQRSTHQMEVEPVPNHRHEPSAGKNSSGPNSNSACATACSCSRGTCR